MKITARVTFWKDNREALVQAFFNPEEYSPKNKIRIFNDKVAFVQLEFDNNPPQGICKALSYCVINWLDNFGKASIEDLVSNYVGTQDAKYADEPTIIEVSAEDKSNEQVEAPATENNEEQVEAPATENNEEQVETPATEGNEEQVEAPATENNEEQVETPATEGNEEQVEAPAMGGNEEQVETPATECNEEQVEAPATEGNEEQVEAPATENNEEQVATDSVSETELESENQNNTLEVSTVDEADAEPVAVNETHTRKCRRGLKKPSEDDYIDIPSFTKLSESVTNFSGFMTEVEKWLKLSEDDAKYLTGVITELCIDVSKLGQKGYEICIQQVKNANQALGYKDCKRVKFSKVICRILDDKGVYCTFLTFLKTILKYNEYFSKSKDQKENLSVDNNKAKPCENIVQNEYHESDDVALMNCDGFARIVKGIPKDTPINEKVSTLFSRMGLKASNGMLYKKVCEITVTAFSMEELASIDDVMIKAGIDVGNTDGMRIKLRFSEWINSYNKSNHIKRMKVIAFLRALKTIFT